MTTRISFAAAIAIAVALLIVVGTEQQDSEAVFPGTNGKIAFGNFTNNKFDVWTMNADGSGRTQVSTTPGGTAAGPAFSPDGQTIGFVLNSLTQERGLYTVGADGAGQAKIPNTDVGDIDLTWAPSGDKIAFERLSGPSDVYSMNLDGTNLANLTSFGSFGESSPDWSPLGDKIAYASGDIWMMNTDGSDKTNVTNLPGTSEDNPDGSPDGTKIIFDMTLPTGASGGGFLGNRDIAVINADGTGFQMITNDPNTDQYDPVFSPDGQQIAYTQRPTDGLGVAGFGVTGIIVADADGTNAHDISGGSPNDFGADWGVDEPATPTPSPTPSPTPAPGETRIWGDHNCSDSADPVDSLVTLRADAGLSTNTGACPDMGDVVEVINASPHPWGDVDCSGSIDPVDSLKLLRFDAGLSVSQTGNCPLIGSEVQLAGS